jgi:signal transduction histidine kinase
LTLLEVSRAISSTLELEPLLELILDELKVVADYSGASVCVVEGDAMRILASRGATSADREDDAVGMRRPLLQGGAIWQALNRGRPAIIPDVRGEGPLAEGYRAWLGPDLEAAAFRYVRSSLFVPLVAQDRVIGLISMSRREPDQFTPRHARLALGIASQAALAIENARLYSRARADERRTAALAQIASIVALAGSLDRVLDDLARRVVETTGAQASAVFVTEGDLTAARLAGMHGLPPKYASGIEAAMQAGKLTFTLDDLDPARPLVRRIVWQTLLARPALANLRPFASQVGWDMTVLVPLATRGRKFGVLANYYHHEQEPDGEELAFLSAVGNQAAIAVENARLFAEAQEKASLEERARLARDLHDSATQTVFSVGMLAEAARAQHERGSERLGETLDRVATLAQQAHAEMRALLVELRPDAALQDGPREALDRLLDAVRTRSGLLIEQHGRLPASLPGAQAQALLRIVQEALNNAIKHAQASAVTVAVAECEDGLVVRVSDDGAGFDPAVLEERAQAAGGLGMRSMRERAAAAGLRLQVRSTPGAGTTVQLTLATP